MRFPPSNQHRERMLRAYGLALASHLAGERMMRALDRLQGLAEKAGFNPDQPRVPGGGPGGGR